ncbi:MAG: DNA polymerase/3'-5' exonuclease PolX [Candidatus Bathyarchaeota archaeon]|nr:DNA polymerase/3'-5' exonuclease PolX [Candidatus Bathyarchaeota archaeon]
MSFNAQIATLLYEISEILTIKQDRFRSRAYSTASQRVTALTEDIREIAVRGELEDIPGVGKGIAAAITEYIETGESMILQELRESLPQGVPEMITIEGIGPRIAMRLHEELGVTNVQALEAAAKEGRVRELKGFGSKKEENILKAIEEKRSRSTRFLLGEVLPIIQGILTYMGESIAVQQVEVAGSARRMKETVGDLDILVSSTFPEEVTRRFVGMPPVARVLAQGPTKSTVVLKNQLQVDLRVLPPESYGAALQYFTGSKGHNVKLRTIGVREGFKLNEYGLFRRDDDTLVESRDEARIYEAMGMDWMPPELRENTGEIEAAMEHKLPELIELGDVKGDLHMHSNWSDGKAPIEAMAEKAMEMGLEYIAVCDHTKSLRIANGLDEKRLTEQINAIKYIDEQNPNVKILAGTECDIKRDGKLDIKDSVLAELDWVVASVHSGFKMEETEMTARIIKAIHNPHVRAIGHPTGRLIQRRSPYAVNLDKIFEAAAEHDVFMEINCYPDRLDLSDVDSRRAKETGVKLCLGSDAHAPKELEFIPMGVAVARRGWLGADDVVNTWSVEKVLGYRK